MGLFSRKNNYSDNMKFYFSRAMNVWIWLEDNAAYIAAVAAAKTCNSHDRNELIKGLEELVNKWAQKAESASEVQEKEHWIKATGKLMMLYDNIKAKEWSIKDSISERKKLYKIDPEYEKALGKADHEVFVRRYPDYFEMLKKS